MKWNYISKHLQVILVLWYVLLILINGDSFLGKQLFVCGKHGVIDEILRFFFEKMVWLLGWGGISGIIACLFKKTLALFIERSIGEIRIIFLQNSWVSLKLKVMEQTKLRVLEKFLKNISSNGKEIVSEE